MWTRSRKARPSLNFVNVMANKRKPWWERRESDLQARSWLELRDIWLASCPPEREAGVLPEIAVAELPSVTTVAPELAAQGRKAGYARTLRNDIEGVKTGVLLEGVALLHKAANVAGAGQVDFSAGLRTWSISTCYQAAMFAARSLMCLLGVVVAEVENDVFIVDVCSRDRKSGARRRPSRTEVLISWACSGRVEHRPIWSLLMRLLRVTKIDASIWPARWVAALASKQVSEFGRQRNRLHYKPSAWLFDDLHELVPAEQFGCFGGRLRSGEVLDEADVDDFTVALAFVLVRMAALLLDDLARDSGVLHQERVLLRRWHESPINETFLSEFADGQSGIAP